MYLRRGANLGYEIPSCRDDEDFSAEM